MLGMALCLLQGHAQTRNTNVEDFEAFRKSIFEDYDDFRAKINAEYIEFLKNPWVEHKKEDAVPQPDEDTQPPVIYDQTAPLDTVPAPTPTPPPIDVVTPPAPSPQPQPVVPIEEVPQPEDEQLVFTFYGTEMKVRLGDSQRFSIGSISDKSVSRAFERLLQDDYLNLVYDCLVLRSVYSMNDWCYLLMLNTLSSSFCGKDTPEAELLMAYVCLQSGYRIRFAYDSQRLYMLFACDHIIYGRGSFNIDGQKYYSLHELPPSVFISPAAFPNEQNFSLLLYSEPQLSDRLSTPRTIRSERYPDVQCSVSVNLNLLDFFSDYPSSALGDNFLTRWAMYANTPVSPDVADACYPALSRQLSGLTPLDAANRLLNLVQTGLAYEYDDKVWGYDRAFFAEESLYYPYCDCEDRSILFTHLVRDLLDLDCLLVYTPGHLFTAVAFPDEVSGESITLQGRRYTMADPTYIGAPVGATQSCVDRSSLQVIKLQR